MIYMRGQKEDWDHWARLGNRGWAWDDVLPVFKSLEDYERGATDGYGAGGEVRIEDPRVRWEIIDAFREAAAQCGIPPVKVFNNGDNFGCAYFQMNQKRGRRWSATNAFLRPVLQRPNLTVLTDAMVTRLRMHGRQAQGVELLKGGEALFAEAKRETVLAAGAIGSPQLLQVSGVGPGALLHRLGIAVVHDLRGVGENLHDHLQIRMQYKVKNVTTLNGVANTWIGKAAMAAEYVLFRTGPLTMPPSQAGAFAKRGASSRPKRWRSTSPRNIAPAWRCRKNVRWKRRRASSARRSSIRWAPARWAATRWRWSTTSCACTASSACA